MHSMRLEPPKLIIAGTRATYQATGDAGLYLEEGNVWVSINFAA